MKKKLVLVIIVAILGIILFLENVCKISIFDSVKQVILGQEKMSNNGENNSNEFTVIDVTNLTDNGSIQHEHILKTVYNENEHWSECTICSEKINIKEHTYTTTWASGVESCEKNNYYTKTCTCGYSFTGHKPCVWDGNNYEQTYGENAYVHIRICSICKDQIFYEYYGPDNKLHSAEYTSNAILKEPYFQKCISKTNGNTITCSNLGTCNICRKNVYILVHYLMVNDNNEIYCRVCNKKYGTYVQTIEEISTAPATYKITDRVYLTNGAEFRKTGEVRNIGNPLSNNSMTLFSDNTNPDGSAVTRTNYTLSSIATFKSTWKAPYLAYTMSYVTINGNGAYLRKNFYISPDSIKPMNVNIEVQDEWSRTKPIVVSGTENYCDTVNLEILDENGNTIFNGRGKVNSKKFSISCVPDLEIDTNGKTFIAIITDSCENSTTQEFRIAKVDAKAPIATSENNITGEWSKSRKFTFKAIDNGIGEVSIAFNDMEDLRLASFDGAEYTRDYEFIGDVYTPKELSVVYKDGLDNTSIQKVTIDKIDNTAPTIVNASIHNNIVNIDANDECGSLGQGSGIVKYRYITSTEKLDNPIISSEIEVNANEKIVIDKIYQVKYIYIEAEDLVGNISDVYEIKVPELILTSKVDLNLADGKGEIILDWSSYDITDKYFVIYRREENQSDWKEIVSLDDKLCDNKYTDILANDKNKPTVPVININGDMENNDIKIESNSMDNGDTYSYYIEAYDRNGALLQESITTSKKS